MQTNTITAPPTLEVASTLTLVSTLLAACGGGGDSSTTAPQSGAPIIQPAALPTEKEAARFTGQVLFTSPQASVDAIKTKGYAAWLDEQFLVPQSETRWEYLANSGFGDIANVNGQNGFDQAMWKKLLSSPDELRQRMTLALSEILVLSIDGVPTGFRQFAAASYMDTVESFAFGNYRQLLGAISTHIAMGVYLTYRGNVKANTSGTLPDENYARELMQLFTIGLYQLNPDGTLKLTAGKPVESYTQDDVTNLARVFTGWDHSSTDNTTPERNRVPMTMNGSRHSPEAKNFLGLSIPANTDGITSLKLALDHIFAHANLPPFICKQLIQRFVCSNPSAAYVQRVAAVFIDNGSAVRGDLKAVIRAVLLDAEATTNTGGKLKEPLLRFVQWARTFGATTTAAAGVDQWKIGNTSDAATKLGQSPGRSPSVFNFFRPGYVPPASSFAAGGLTAPEFQITHESSVVGYINYMQTAIISGVGDVKANYTSWLTLASDPTALMAAINARLAAGAISSATLATIASAVGSIASATDADKTKRVQAAVLLALASPEFLVQK